jgi:hypothetical protein
MPFCNTDLVSACPVRSIVFNQKAKLLWVCTAVECHINLSPQMEGDKFQHLLLPSYLHVSRYVLGEIWFVQ